MNARETVLPIEPASEPAMNGDCRLGRILVEAGKLDEASVNRVVALQRNEGLRFGEAAVRLSLISNNDLQSAVARQFKFPYLPAGYDGLSREVVTAYEPFHPRAEEMRTLRTQLLVHWHNAGVHKRVLALVSPGPREGRSYVAANLAIVFSQLGERTLLIDADLRSPRQHRIFNVSNRVGLSAILSGRADHRAVVRVPGFDTLSLMPSGARPPNPQELLLRGMFANVLDELTERYDNIVVDTPPAAHCADAQILALRAGSAIVLARKDRTRVADTTRVVRDLNNAGIGIVGTLYNAF
jgi:protein-tyrosine kinase